MILAGDVGGTKAELGLFDVASGPRRPHAEGRLATREFESLEALTAAFLAGHAGASRIERATFGIAGPVQDNRSEATNMAWTIDGASLGARLGARVTLINDLAANAYGLDVLGANDFAELQPGARTDDTRALIAAGTGLGESIVARIDGAWVPIASEGGHSDFAPRDALEDELSGWLRARHGRVSCERVLSGPGLADLYRFLSATGRGHEPAAVAERFAAAPDPAAVVTATALDGSCERARLAVEKFVEVYGAEAGNLALKALALGGVFVGGGIAPRILPFLRDRRFNHAFSDKGRLGPVLAKIPVSVILDPRTALWGAAAYALEHP